MMADMQFDHIGIVVADLPGGRRFLRTSLGVTRWSQPFEDMINDVDVQFGADRSGLCYELVVPRSSASPMRRALDKKTNITNHIAYRVADLAAAAQMLSDQGCVAVGEPKPAVAYGDAPIQFFLSPIFSLVELIEAIDHRHIYDFEQD